MEERTIKNGCARLLLPTLLWAVAGTVAPGVSADDAPLHWQHIAVDETIMTNGYQAMESMQREMLQQLHKDLARQFQGVVEHLAMDQQEKAYHYVREAAPGKKRGPEAESQVPGPRSVAQFEYGHVLDSVIP